jgi:hypothetical protein
MRHRHGRKRRDNRLVVATALVLSAVAVWQSSYSAFAVTTQNTGNTWVTGQMALGTTAGALFDSTTNTIGMRPGFTLDRCLTVTYTGTIGAGAPVRVYATGMSTDTSSVANNSRKLSDYLVVTIDESTVAATVACVGFPGAGYTTVVNGVTMTPFGAKTTYALGYPGAWQPAVTNETRTYRIRITFPSTSNAVDTDLMGLNASTTFTWEVQS